MVWCCFAVAPREGIPATGATCQELPQSLQCTAAAQRLRSPALNQSCFFSSKTTFLSLCSSACFPDPWRHKVWDGLWDTGWPDVSRAACAVQIRRGFTPGERWGRCLAASSLCCLLSSAELPQPPSSQPASARLVIRNIFKLQNSILQGGNHWQRQTEADPLLPFRESGTPSSQERASPAASSQLQGSGSDLHSCECSKDRS